MLLCPIIVSQHNLMTDGWAVEEHQHSNRAGIWCLLVWGGAQPEPYRIKFKRLFLCMFLTRLLETDNARMTWGSQWCYRDHNVCHTLSRLTRSQFEASLICGENLGVLWLKVIKLHSAGLWADTTNRFQALVSPSVKSFSDSLVRNMHK